MLPGMAVVCLVLVALLAVIQVTHVHPVDTDASHCPLCIAMHSAAPVAAPAAVIVLVSVGVPAPVAKVRALVRYWHPKLLTRPPPVAC